MTPFPSCCPRWASCPGLDESAGKRRSTRVRKTKGAYYQAQSFRERVEPIGSYTPRSALFQVRIAAHNPVIYGGGPGL